MEYFLSFLFLALHLFDYENNLPSIVFFSAGLVLFCALFRVCYNKSGDFLCACMMMFCHTWQASWYNVLGDWGSPLQITWFYIIGAMILVYCMFNVRKVVNTRVNAFALASFVSLFIFLPYPLIISKSFGEGIKEYLIIAFFLVVSFVAFIFRRTIPYEKRKYVADAFIFNMVLSCALLFLQYILQHYAGLYLFRYEVRTYFGSSQVSSKLLMEDSSSSTIMIGGAVFYLLEKLNKKNWLGIITMAVILMAGIGVTTRRTSIVTLAVVLVFYVLLHYKGTFKKLTMSLIVVAMMAVMFLYLFFTRSISNISTLIYDNGRIEIARSSLEVLWKNPFGVGYDNKYIQSLVGGIVPHNTMLRWLVMGGWIFGVLMFVVGMYFVFSSLRKKNKTEFWFIIFGLLASNLIPDLLNARLFVLPVMMALLIEDERNDSNEESTPVQSRNELQSRL